MSTNQSNWIVETGQAWKLYVAVAGFTGALLCFTLGIFSLVTGGERFLALVSCGLFLGCATFLWFTAVLRCPHCANKLVWTMVSTRPHSSWVVDLAALESCPACGGRLDRVA
ncbi:MAG: hypothetical protein EPO64_01205 [Nitrospirae bacterium]|nr:MAG: hypothetical protein EPO64_01205 [Nitrospirota bacterium]